MHNRNLADLWVPAHSQHTGCWWPGNSENEGISTHVTGPNSRNHPGFNTRCTGVCYWRERILFITAFQWIVVNNNPSTRRVHEWSQLGITFKSIAAFRNGQRQYFYIECILVEPVRNILPRFYLTCMCFHLHRTSQDAPLCVLLCFVVSRYQPIPADTLRANNVFIKPKQHCDVVLT